MVSKIGKKSGILAASMTLLAAPLLIAPPTQAAPEPAPEKLLSCDMSGKASFAPALSLNPSGQRTRVNVTAEATRCSSRSGLDVTSAQLTGALTGRMSCSSPPRDVNGDVEITWTRADGSTATSTANFALDLRGDLSNPSKPITGTFTGQNTDGAFRGNEHRGQGKIDSSGLARGCFTGGLESLNFNGSYRMTK